MLEERRDTMGGDFNYIVSKYTIIQIATNYFLRLRSPVVFF